MASEESLVKGESVLGRQIMQREGKFTLSSESSGTANIDRLSMTGNYEINVEFIDPGMAEKMEQIYATDLSNSVELTADTWAARGIHKKFTELVLAPLRPLL